MCSVLRNTQHGSTFNYRPSSGVGVVVGRGGAVASSVGVGVDVAEDSSGVPVAAGVGVDSVCVSVANSVLSTEMAEVVVINGDDIAHWGLLA